VSDTARIPLRARDGSVRAWALVDLDDSDMLDEYRWFEVGGYAARTQRPGTILMHRELLGLVRGDARQVDHLNGDPLDNRRENLRVSDGPLGLRGESQHRGVTRFRDKWMARATIGGRVHYLGVYDDDEEAGSAVRAFLDQERFVS
jgi:hypothetical protein